MFSFLLLFGISKERVESYPDALSHHDVLAEFLRIEHIPCRFLTTLCPDHCDHATDVAVFKVLKYNEYKLNEKYGDEKQEIIYVDVKKKIPRQEPQIAEIALELKPGQNVRLIYDHIYIEQDGVQSPARPCLAIDLIEPTL